MPEAVAASTTDAVNTITYRDDDPELTRDCNYYEEYAMTEAKNDQGNI